MAPATVQSLQRTKLCLLIWDVFQGLRFRVRGSRFGVYGIDRCCTAALHGVYLKRCCDCP